MTKDLVIKANWLNQAIAPLSIPELRIIQLAVIDARETGKGLSADNPLRIDASRYAEAFNTTRQNAYARMKEAESTLFKRQFTFTDTDGYPVKSAWVQDVKYFDGAGAIEMRLTYQVVRGITRIDGAVEFFTQYLLSQTANLSNVYAVRLYELLIQWRSVGKTPEFKLESLRGQLGLCVNEYEQMTHFKTRVLGVAIKQINEHTDIEVTYEQVKTGRKISGFTFKFKQKSKAVSEVKATPKEKTPPKDVSGFAGVELQLLKSLQARFPEISEQYVREYAKMAQIDVFGALNRIQSDYQPANDFALAKTD
ncbi:MAG: replication initiation protein RepM [Gammaproteobacteria bacterium]|nr:replication initiation protein RepM [Gammaproteobacteria bacterium]